MGARRCDVDLSNVPNPIAAAQQPPSLCQNRRIPMTERLYYTDAYLREFTARVVGQSDEPRAVYLDRTAFYPTSGGQPYDTGSIARPTVVEVVAEDDRRAHRLAAPVGDGAGERAVDCLQALD